MIRHRMQIEWTSYSCRYLHIELEVIRQFLWYFLSCIQGHQIGFLKLLFIKPLHFFILMSTEIVKLDISPVKVKLPQTQSTPMILENYTNIHSLIEKMHSNIQQVFRRREDALLANYRKEMVKAQRQLKELSENTSENELRRRMIEKKEALERERQVYLKESLEFSNRCKDLKLTLQEVITTTKDLESEINFLDEQLIYSQKHHETLKEELAHLEEDRDIQSSQQKLKESFLPPPVLKPDISKQNAKVINFVQMKQTISKFLERIMRDHSAPKSLPRVNREATNEQLRLELERQKEINSKLQQLVTNACFQESVLERNFNQACVAVVQTKERQDEKQLELQRRKPRLFPAMPGEEVNQSRSTNPTTIDYTTLNSDTFNEYYKRKIFEDFLERDEIKKIIHELLFSKQ